MPYYNITSENQDKIKQIKNKALIKVHSLSCGWCRQMAPEFEKFKNNKKLKNVNIFDLEMSNASTIDMPFVKHAMNNGVPQLYIINNKGEILKEYTGNRTADDMFHFSKELINIKKTRIKKSRKKIKNRKKRNKTKKNINFGNVKSKKNRIIRSLTPWYK
jgi:thiol-disulfide isomerase/thioredoxin